MPGGPPPPPVDRIGFGEAMLEAIIAFGDPEAEASGLRGTGSTRDS